MVFFRIRYGLKHVDRTFYMGGASLVSRDFVAGPYTFMNYGCDICPRVKVGSYVMFGPRVIITGSDHEIGKVGVPMYFTKRPELPETNIEDDVWLGARAIIMAGVRIGRGSVVAAGAVVTKDVEPYTIVGGVPAAFLKMRFEDPDDTDKHDKLLRSCRGDWRYSDPINWIIEE